MIVLKCLVIGNFTVDVIDSVEYVGGSSYYSGWSLKQLDCDVYVLSTVSSRYRELFRELLEYFNIIEYSCSSNPVFVIENGRAVGLKEPGCAIPIDLINETFVRVDPDIVLITPVFREVDLGDEKLCRVLCSDVIKSLEIHGLTRDLGKDGLINTWLVDLFKYFKFFNIVHGNIYEYCFSNDLLYIINKLLEYSSLHNTSFQVSMDNQGMYLVDKGSTYYFPPINENILNILGAGDVLLATTTFYIGLKQDNLEATKRGLIASYLKMKTSSKKWFTQNTIEKNIDLVKYIKLQ